MKFRNALLVATVLVPSGVQAQAVNGLYIGAGAGANFMHNEDVSVRSYPAAFPAAQRGRIGPRSLSYDTGFVGLASVGYGFGNGLRVEVEGSYRQNKIDRFGGPTGFQAGGDLSTSYERMKIKVNDELKQHFRPEFLNRVDDVVVFPQLTQAEIIQIVDLMVGKLDERLRDKDMGIELTQKAKDHVATKGYDPVLGARPLRRTIQRDIEDALSEKILYGELKAGEIVLVDAEGEGKDTHLTFVGSAKASVPDAPVVEMTKE